MTLELHQTASPAPAAAKAEAPAPVRSSFYAGLRILPRDQRQAMYAIYAFCRAVDDIADTVGPAEERLARLDRWAGTVAALFAGGPPPMELEALREAVRDFDLRREDLLAVIAGMAMDVRGETAMPTRETLDLYCDRVASAPGRLSVRVFGIEEGAGLVLAHHLGRALQLTNILRDLDEDAAMERLYLPREALAAAGLAGRPIAAILADPAVADACATLSTDAHRHFGEAARVMDALPRDQVRAPRLMAAAYHPLLRRLETRGWTAPRRRIGKRKRDLVGAVLRYGIV